MQTIISKYKPGNGKSFLLFLASFLVLGSMEAQQRPSKPSSRGTSKPSTASKPSSSRPSASKPSTNKPSASKPSASKPSASKPSASKPSASKPSTNNNKTDIRNAAGNNKKPDINKSDADRKNNISNSGNKTNNIGSNNNKVNVDKSKKNVNINVDNSKDIRINNSRNTSVRRVNNYRPYTRPPYRYGGYRYNCYRPYYYHPYRPFVWGPRWHPWGFFVATLATTAIIISIADNDMPDMNPNGEYFVMADYGYPAQLQRVLSGPYDAMLDGHELVALQDYYYDEGVFYLKVEGGYTVVAAPIGATIKTLPAGYETLTLEDGKTINYYYGGTFYEKTSKGFTVVPPTAGTLVEHLPEGGEEVQMGDVKYVKVGDTYYQPVKENGKDLYEIADVEEDK